MLLGQMEVTDSKGGHMNDDNKAGARLSFTKQELYDRFGTRSLDPQEVALALQIMDHDGDNVAHFGINGHYIFSEFNPEVGGLQ